MTSHINVLLGYGNSELAIMPYCHSNGTFWLRSRPFFFVALLLTTWCQVESTSSTHGNPRRAPQHKRFLFSLNRWRG